MQKYVYAKHKMSNNNTNSSEMGKKMIMLLKRSDFMLCYPLGLHCRHETPVLSKPIDVIHLSEDLVVLDKPCSLPVSVQCYNYQNEFLLELFVPYCTSTFFEGKEILL